MLDEHLHVLTEAGIKAEIVTGSGTGACAYDATGTFTELQVGSYVFMDSDYGKLEHEGGALPYDPAMLQLNEA